MYIGKLLLTKLLEVTLIYYNIIFFEKKNHEKNNFFIFDLNIKGKKFF